MSVVCYCNSSGAIFCFGQQISPQQCMRTATVLRLWGKELLSWDKGRATDLVLNTHGVTCSCEKLVSIAWGTQRSLPAVAGPPTLPGATGDGPHTQK